MNGICSVTDTIKEVVGGFDTNQMIAIGAVALIALLLGIFIGACTSYASGVSKGKKAGAKEVVAYAKERVAEQASEHRKALLEAKRKNEILRRERDAALIARHESSGEAQGSEKQTEETDQRDAEDVRPNNYY